MACSASADPASFQGLILPCQGTPSSPWKSLVQDQDLTQTVSLCASPVNSQVSLMAHLLHSRACTGHNMLFGLGCRLSQVYFTIPVRFLFRKRTKRTIKTPVYRLKTRMQRIYLKRCWSFDFNPNWCRRCRSG